MDLIKCNSCNQIIDNQKMTVYTSAFYPKGIYLEKPIRLNICTECVVKTFGDDFKNELRKCAGIEDE